MELRDKLKDVDMVYKMIKRPNAYFIDFDRAVTIGKVLGKYVVKLEDYGFPYVLQFSDPYSAAECFIEICDCIQDYRCNSGSSKSKHKDKIAKIKERYINA